MTSKNTDNAHIIIQNKQTVDGRTDMLNTEADGRFYYKNGKYYIMYRQCEDNVCVSTMIKAEPKSVVVKRSGAYESRMIYDKQGEQSFLYTTPYGQMPITLVTRDLKIQLGDNGGTIKLWYELWIGKETYHNQMNIMVISKEERKIV